MREQPRSHGSRPLSEVQQVLALVSMPDAVSADEVSRQAQALAATLDRNSASNALRALAELGLVRVASQIGGQPTYVRTTLGREYAEGFLAATSPLSTRLAELEQLRTDFVATVAHELKTPLTAIRTCVGLLTDSSAQADPAIHRRLLDRVSASAEGMQHLIEALLDLARSRSGDLPLQARWISANEVAREAIALISPLLENRDQEVRLSVPEPAPMLYGDRPRLVQALANILSNAQRFSPERATIGVTVRADEDRASGAAWVSWQVKDTGPGISDADQRHLFERFFRGRSDIEGGTGLGLPIALATVQAHEGTIDVSSELGAGSTFTITVPVNGGTSEEGPQQ